MLLDLNECPLCGARKTDADFCDACTEEIEEADPHWFCCGYINAAFRYTAAVQIMHRNGRAPHYFQEAARQAKARLEHAE